MLLASILAATPVRIWALLAALIALGLAQTRPRTIGALRSAALPAVFLALSLAGAVSSFGPHAIPFAAWIFGTAFALAVAPRLLPAAQASWAASGNSVDVAGSWLPLVLILALFITKYVAGVSVAMHPALAAHAAFATPVSVAYGLFSGTFAARGLQIWRARPKQRA